MVLFSYQPNSFDFCFQKPYLVFPTLSSVHAEGYILCFAKYIRIKLYFLRGVLWNFCLHLTFLLFSVTIY